VRSGWMAAVIALACLAGQAVAAENAAARLDPAERCDVHEWQSNWRVAVRFDLARVRNLDKVSRATLHLGGKAPATPVEVRPITTDWGGLSAAFKKRELEGVWRPEDLNRPDWTVASEMWLLGEADWTWAVRGVAKWRTPGGDFGPVAATVKPGAAADVTDPVTSWIAKPEVLAHGHTGGSDLRRPLSLKAASPAPVRQPLRGANFGLMLTLVEEGKEQALRGCRPFLVFEGQGVSVDATLRIDDHPKWLPTTYKVRHPRLPYPTQAWLAALKADKKRLAALVERADSFNPERGRASALASLVLAQRLAPTNERAELISRAVDAKFPNHGGFAICYGLAVLYDWGYDLLQPADRRRLAWRLDRMCYGQESGCASTTISPYNDVGTSRYGCGLVWAALAIYPDIPGARKHVWRAKSYYIDTSIPVWRQVMGADGGYWHELHGYYLGTCIGNALARCLSAWTSATGEDLYRKNPWLENWLYFGIYSTRPDLYRIRIGDIKCSEHAYGEAPISLYSFPALAKRYDNPYGRWWVQRFGGATLDGVTPTEDPWGEPFRKDATTRSPDSLPLVRHSDGLGVVNMRSDWTEDATAIWFKCGPSFWSHSHMDAGAFAVYKRGALAIDAGNYTAGYSSQHYSLYGRLTYAHNVVTVTDPNDPALTWQGQAVPNDGGQRFTSGGHGATAPYSVANWAKRKEEFDTGRIVAFETTKDFTYVCGDVTRAYTNALSGTGHKPSRSKRVRKLLRTLVFLPPDHLVVFDQVESFDKAFKKRWLLHTINEPKVSGTLTTVERADLCFRFSRWDRSLKYAIRATKDHPFFKAHPDCKWYGGYQPQLYQYDGVMFVRTLLPAKPEIVVVGGPGKECWFNGRSFNGALGGRTVSFRPYTGEGEAGRYRIEVSPGAAAENDRFLNVIQVGVNSGNPKPTTARLLDVDDGTAVEVALGGGTTATITFTSGVGGHITVKRGGATVVDRDFAQRVLPNPATRR